MSKLLTSYALLISLALTLSPYCQSIVHAASALDKDSTRISFDPANNLIIISATINGKGPFRFLLDTGASHHVMKPELAQTLGLKVTSGGEIEAGGKENVSAGLVDVAELRVGDFALARQRFFVKPFPPSYPFDGFIGAELFERYIVNINFQQSLITLVEPGTFRYRGSGISLPLKFHEGLIPQVRAEVDDCAGSFKLDTGYNGSLALFEKFIEQHKLLVKYAPRKSGSGGQTLTGEVSDSPVALIRKFKLSDVVLNNVEASFFLDKEGSNSAYAGAIGTALLNRFNVTLDYKAQRMILESREVASD